MKVFFALAICCVCVTNVNGVYAEINYDKQRTEKTITTPEVAINEKLENEGEKTEEKLQVPTAFFGGPGDHVIIRIAKLGNRYTKPDGIDEKHDSIPDQNEFENTTIPPMICWEMTCPDCAKQESDIRCFLRSLLTVLVRLVLCLVGILLLMACVKIATGEKKKVDIKVNCGQVNKDDKTQLIENCEKGLGVGKATKHAKPFL